MVNIKPIAIVVHHEAGNNGFGAVNEYHRTKWNFRSTLGFYIGYQWYYDKQKGWIQGRAETEEGAHTLGGWNRKAVGVCVQGDYSKETLSGEVKKELWDKIEEIRKRWNIPQSEVFGHKELQLSKPTTCPVSLMFFVQSYRNTPNENIVDLERKVGKLQKIVKLLMQLVRLKNLLRKRR